MRRAAAELTGPSVLFVGEGEEVPSTRFRVLPFIRRLEASGIRCAQVSAFGRWYGPMTGSALSAPYRLLGRAKRGILTVLKAGGYDVLFLQRLALPWTALPETLAGRRNSRIVFDFDDSIFLGPDGEPAPLRARAVANLVARSARVVAGNAFLAERAGAPEKTVVIPTVVDTEVFRPLSQGAPAPDRDIVIGWMGTSGHFAYFPAVMPAIERVLEERPKVRLRLVCNAPYRPLVGHPRVDQVAWSPEREVEEVQRFDIGIMPLPDNGWTRGKCGLKMIQYMAVGRPVVVSPVGANADILADGSCGLAAKTPEQWYQALHRLLADTQLRQRMGEAGRKRAVQHYSIEAVLPSYLRLLHGVAATSEGRPTFAAGPAGSGAAVAAPQD